MERISCFLAAATVFTSATAFAAPAPPAPQRFRQEIAHQFPQPASLAGADVQLMEISPQGFPRALAAGGWWEFHQGAWREAAGLRAGSENEFVVANAAGEPVRVSLPWRGVRQVLRAANQLWIVTAQAPYLVTEGAARTMEWPSRNRVAQCALGPDGTFYVASTGGLFRQVRNGWAPIESVDPVGRSWGVQDVLGVAFDTRNQLWFVTKAGAACRTDAGWRFYEGKDGLPWNDFTGITSGPEGTMWFGTRLGVIRFDGKEWHYRQGPRWLPQDDVRQVAVDGQGNAWLATARGVGQIEFPTMTLAEKAARYETEIAKHIKRTPYGYVAEAALKQPGDKTSANPHDSDNDGLWTAMYGAGECFAFGATGDPQARERAKQAFEALRFLQKVTEGGTPAPPRGYIARTIRPQDWPDPNVGRIERDREEQKGDHLWKVYEPRWPKSADGKWYWKSDTSSDELDGHYFFYPLYFDLCAQTPDEKERVRDVVRQITDHLIDHNYRLVDHDGKPTRWGMFNPQHLNADPNWWPERGLNSLSMLSYLAAAAHVTGDPKYESASRELIDKHGYAQNAMFAKVHHGPGSGNQSDDEMAFMAYYTLLRCSRDEPLKAQIRYSFFSYWANESPELNPFFNFAYAAHNGTATITNVWGSYSVAPFDDWFEDSLATLRGLPLDRFNWSHRNSHRLDIQPLGGIKSKDLYDRREGGRGHRGNGKVLPVENRHFNHWNTDPWRLDYGGNGNELAAGTVFLLPYYLGLYHGFIAKP